MAWTTTPRNKKGCYIMITILFGFASDKVLVTIKGKKVTFASTAFGAVESEIDGLQLNYEGVIKEHPDLKDNSNWKSEAISRYKEHINSLNSESEIVKYVVRELRSVGYIPEKIEKEGFRPENI